MKSLIKQNKHGVTSYISKDHKYYIFSCDDLWYVKDLDTDSVKFNAGLVNITAVDDLFFNLDSYIEQLNMLGYYDNDFSDDFYRSPEDDLKFSKVSIASEPDDQLFHVDSIIDVDGTEKEDHFKTNQFNKLIDHIISFFDKNGIEVFASTIITNTNSNSAKVLSAIQTRNRNNVFAAITSRDISSTMSRVKSSNIWSMTIDIKDRKNKFGDLYIQFKGTNGGPTGGIYKYYDVPIKIYRAFITAPSKGHFFWQYIRNVYKYSKLDGNKRGVLPNAIN